MTRTIALSLIYLMALYAIAAGAQLFARGVCSDWLKTCTVVEVRSFRTAEDVRRPVAPAEVELR